MKSGYISWINTFFSPLYEIHFTSLAMNKSLFSIVFFLALSKIAISTSIPLKCQKPISLSNRGFCCSVFNIGCLSIGSRCSTTPVLSFRPIPCKKGLTCVITDFGFLPVDIPSSGVCLRLLKRPPTCSVGFCTRNGPKGICEIDGTTTICNAWAERRGIVGTEPQCDFACTEQFCPEFLASDGRLFCTGCQLASAACASNFTVFGPVAVKPCRRIGPSMMIRKKFREVCCNFAGIGCDEIH